MLDAIEHIREYTRGISFAQYDGDAKTQDAVERRLQIVTEAAYRLGKDAEVFAPGPDWSDWCGLGNILRHGYHKIDNRIIWQKVHELNGVAEAARKGLAGLPDSQAG